MVGFVYILCALTSFACAVMLMRGYFKNKVRLLFWSGLCFICLALNNIILFIDLIIVQYIDLALLRNGLFLLGLVLLLYGLIRDNDA